jgi:hypothetical protein
MDPDMARDPEHCFFLIGEMIRPLSQLGLRELYQGGHEVAHPVSTVSARRDQTDVVGRVRVLNNHNRNQIRIVKKLISGDKKEQPDPKQAMVQKI